MLGPGPAEQQFDRAVDQRRLEADTGRGPHGCPPVLAAAQTPEGGQRQPYQAVVAQRGRGVEESVDGHAAAQVTVEEPVGRLVERGHPRRYPLRWAEDASDHRAGPAQGAVSSIGEAEAVL